MRIEYLSAAGRPKKEAVLYYIIKGCLFLGYFISCSKSLNTGAEKNSPRVMSSPSQNFLIVTDRKSVV